MTDEERKQFINEYCRNVGNIKIRCDDCKFVDDCVDYGWKGCKKFTPAPSTQMTNEEWLRSASANDMARCIATKLCELAKHEYGIYDVVDYATVFEWLKEIHE